MPGLSDTREVKDLDKYWLGLQLLDVGVFTLEETSQSLGHNAGCIAV